MRKRRGRDEYWVPKFRTEQNTILDIIFPGWHPEYIHNRLYNKCVQPNYPMSEKKIYYLR